MAVLTQAEVDSLMMELNPRLDTEEHRTEFGMTIYGAIFTAKPSYVSMFSRLQGLSASNVMESDGIRYYGRTLGASLSRMFRAAADKAELDRLLIESGKDHTSRKVTKEQFLGASIIFINTIGSMLTKAENKKSLEKFINYIFPVIAAYI